MTFKPGQEVFSYDAMESEEQLKKEAEDFIGKSITIKFKAPGVTVKGILVGVKKGLLRLYTAKIITPKSTGDITRINAFSNNWSNISVYSEIKKVVIGERLALNPEERHTIINKIFKLLPQK